MEEENSHEENKKRFSNTQIAWTLIGLAVFFLLTSIPFWLGLFRRAVDVAT